MRTICLFLDNLGKNVITKSFFRGVRVCILFARIVKAKILARLV